MTAAASTATEQALRDAMQRLLAGRPRRTDGRLTKNNLYREAQVSRATINRAKDLLAEWDGEVAERADDRDDTSSQEIRDLRRQLEKAARQAVKLRQKLDAATVIGLLHADNAARDTSIVLLDRVRAARE